MKKVLFSLLVLFSFHLASAQDSTLVDYKGTYKLVEGSPAPSVEITIQDGSLYANSSIGSASLSRVSKDTFSIPDHNGMAFFYRNTEGKVKSIKVEVGGMVLEGDKDSAAIALLKRKRFPALSK